MDIIERDGRYFVQCSDGEVERTAEQLQVLTESHRLNQGFLNQWLKTYDGNNWGINQVPRDAGNFIALKLAFDEIEKQAYAVFHRGEGTEIFLNACDTCVSLLKQERANPYCKKELIDFQIESWGQIKFRLSRLAETSPATEQPPASDTEVNDGNDAESGTPWAKIDALSEKIGLREGGKFTPASNKIAAAGAGLIDALREAGILPIEATLPALYAEFTKHYNQKIQADRVSDTRTNWQQKARKGLSMN